MHWSFWLSAALCAVPAFFAWSAIHELSHYVAAASIRRMMWAKFRIYPHVAPGIGFVWASVEYDYEGPNMTAREDAMVSIAPRVMDALAVVATPLAAFLPEPWMAGTWVVMMGAGVVDLAVGSVGASPGSDLMRASHGFGVSPWVVRIAGWFFVVASATFTFAAMFAN